MKQWMVAVMLAGVISGPMTAGAHEGHEHKVMGTVTANHDNRLQVKTTEGKTMSIVLTGSTAVVRGKEKLAVSAVKPGDRVVVDIGDGKEPATAREIKLGAAATPSTARK